MIKYAKIINEETGEVQLGAGCSDGYYISIGMTLLDVELSEKDSKWYILDKCPHYTEEEKFKTAKEKKYNEINSGAKSYLDGGKALFELTPTQHIEATDGNIGKLSAYAIAYVTGVYKPEDVVYWNTKEDESITLNQQQLGEALMGLGTVQAQVWNIKFPTYLEQLEACKTSNEIETLVVDYSK